MKHICVKTYQIKLISRENGRKKREQKTRGKPRGFSSASALFQAVQRKKIKKARKRRTNRGKSL